MEHHIRWNHSSPPLYHLRSALQGIVLYCPVAIGASAPAWFFRLVIARGQLASCGPHKKVLWSCALGCWDNLKLPKGCECWDSWHKHCDGSGRNFLHCLLRNMWLGLLKKWSNILKHTHLWIRSHSLLTRSPATWHRTCCKTAIHEQDSRRAAPRKWLKVSCHVANGDRT